jgi:hypothetical protein
MSRRSKEALLAAAARQGAAALAAIGMESASATMFDISGTYLYTWRLVYSDTNARKHC